MTALAWGAKVSPEFRDKARSIAAYIGTEPSSLMTCIAFETGRTFSPKARNPGSSATGLIQFMRETARSLGTSVEALAEMTAEQQLDYVRDYLRPFTGRVSELGDLYMSILYPPAVGKPDTFVVFENASAAYRANAGLDFDHDGVITKRECVSIVEKLLAEGLQPGNRAFEPQPDVPTIPLEPTPSTGRVPPQPADEPKQPKETAMPLPILALVSAFGPLIAEMIPQVAKLFDRKAETPEKIAAAQKVIETITAASGSAGVDEAVSKMQSSPEVLATVKAAVLTEPAISSILTTEIGGGIAGAREADKATMASDRPFWKTSAVFWISMIMLPMVYWYVGSSVVGGVEIPAEWPWYAALPLKLFGAAWDSGARVGLANLIVGLILGGICGVYYGISVTQNKQQASAKEQA
jgi:hypothetical protein